MKQLEVSLLAQLHKNDSMEETSAILDTLNKQAIDIAPWDDFQYIPNVEFAIAHNNNCIYLKYYVEEAVIKAAYFQVDDPVYKDSCVEFFIAFNNEEEYYNIEFNAIGTCKLNFGRDRHDRIRIPEKLIKKLRFLSIIKNTNNAIRWELCLIIPNEIFFKHDLPSLSGHIGRVNFYKCGDDLPTPHFLCWNKIVAPEPNFHLRKYFGKLLFL
jgi:hypothetical protein